VLMDIQLPLLDGYDATRQINALPGLAAIPIIAVSSLAMKGLGGRAHFLLAAPQSSFDGPLRSARYDRRGFAKLAMIAVMLKRLTQLIS